MTTRLLSAKELALLLGLSHRTVETWGRTGRIPSRKIGTKLRRYDLAEVTAFLSPKEEK